MPPANPQSPVSTNRRLALLNARIARLNTHINNLTQAVKTGNTSQQAQNTLTTSFYHKFDNLMITAIQLTQVLGGLQKVAEYQTPYLRLNMEASRRIANYGDKVVPALTSLNTDIILLETGLENNSKFLSQYINRAELFQEDTETLATGFRNMRNLLNMNLGEESILVKTLINSAKTYHVASDTIVKSFSNLSNELAILSYNKNLAGQKAIGQALAMTEREAPGALQRILAPILTAGMEGFGRAALLGIEGQLQQLQSGNADINTIRSMVKAMEKATSQFEGQDFRVQNMLLETFFGKTAADINEIRRVSELLAKHNEMQVASTRDAAHSLERLQKELLSPIAVLADSAISLLSFLQKRLDQTFVTAMKWLSLSFTFLSTYKFGKFLFGGVGLGGIIKSLIVGALGGFGLNLLANWVSPMEKTAKNTEKLVSLAQSDKDKVSTTEELNRLHASMLSKIISSDSKLNMTQMMSDEGAILQRERLITAMENVYSELRKVREDSTNTPRKSSFAPKVAK